MISNDFSKLDKIIESKLCNIIYSQELLEEFIEVCRRPKFIKYFSQSDFEAVIDAIEEFSEFIAVTSEIKFLNDRKDDFLLSLAIDGKAGYLITGDKALLEIKKYEKTEIINMGEFLLKYDEL